MSEMEPIHPGEHLAEILGELGIATGRLAKAIGMPPRHINEIVRCRRAITADTALRMERALGMTAECWLDLQRLYDLDRARRARRLGYRTAGGNRVNTRARIRRGARPTGGGARS